MNKLVTPLCLALAALPLAAQETRPALPLIPRAPAAVKDPQPDAPAGSYAALVREFEAASLAWRKGYQDAAAEGQEAARKYLTETKQPNEAFVPRFQAGAEEHAGTNEAVPFLVWLAQNDYAHSADHVKTLVTAHIDSEKLGSVVSMLAYGRDPETSMKALDRVAAESPHESVRMAAIYARAKLRLSHGEDDEARALAKQDLMKVVESGDARTAERAKGDIFELEHLQVGMTAPDIEGEDVDGVPFELSDYRGKVVVLDFWGDW